MKRAIQKQILAKTSGMSSKELLTYFNGQFQPVVGVDNYPPQRPRVSSTQM
jgi:hypothetical protein